MKSAILAAILKNGARFRNVLYTVEVGLWRAFQRYITRPDISTRSKVRQGASEAPPLVTNVTKNAWAVEG